MVAPLTIKVPTHEVEVLDQFDGHNFKRWFLKVHFSLIMQKVVYVLQTSSLESYLEDGAMMDAGLLLDPHVMGLLIGVCSDPIKPRKMIISFI